MNLKFWKSEPKKVTEVTPFAIKLVRRTAGNKKGIHSEYEIIRNVMKVTANQQHPYVYFDFEDGSRLSVHQDRLLEWESIVPEPPQGFGFRPVPRTR